MPRHIRFPQTKRDRTVKAQLVALNERLEAMEQRHCLLRRTVEALGRENGVSVGSPCSHCEKSYMLIKNGHMYCPHCGHRRTM
ncbi:hypothetical protein [Natrinema halophilum]|uniref:Uncharacterized protein n=1 Tax=Natrinema halophilum TaxID=1699371 RepID=A0A7D5KC47_9EURY|nr:hypothetical protein [Natrinema halophilum]QLG48336.1 hypothetical protein HYG82_05470 [Natrinema halophilum]